MRTLVQVLRDGPEQLMKDIATRANQLEIVSTGSLTKREAEDVRNMFHSLTVSRCSEWPQPGSPNYLEGDVLESPVVSLAVWRQLLLAHGRRVHMEMSNMRN